jgi:hypothetical protein
MTVRFPGQVVGSPWPVSLYGASQGLEPREGRAPEYVPAPQQGFWGPLLGRRAVTALASPGPTRAKVGLLPG